MLSPYDGTPEGNALGASMDESRERFDEMMTTAGARVNEGYAANPDMLAIVTFFFGAAVVIGMIMFGAAA